MWRDFKAFLLKQNVLALAIAVIIGAAVGKVVTSLVEDLIMPLAGLFVPAGTWRDAQRTRRGQGVGGIDQDRRGIAFE